MARSSLIPAHAPVPAGAEFGRLKDLVIQRTGHFYYQDKDDALWDRVQRRMKVVGVADIAAYIGVLSGSVADSEWTALEAEITIGETYFFRYAEQFTALSLTILPSIIERNRETRRIRVWSAGCASGAEPYSIAVLLGRLLGGEIEHWDIDILGTDINEKFLSLARQAVFGNWALRTVPSADRDDMFTASGPQRWTLRPRFRRMVRFERHNLMSLVESGSLHHGDFDLILCRNVLIYFDPLLIPGIVKGLRDSLVEGGWLLLGHAEPNPAFVSTLMPVSLPGTAAFRRMDGAHGEGAAPPPWEPPALPQDLAPPLEKARAAENDAPPLRRPAQRTQTPAAPPPVRADADEAIRAVKAASDRGDFAAALALCRKAVEHHALEPRLHFYEGLIRRNLAEGGAEDCLKRAIFLDRGLVMAHYHLGLMLTGRGEEAAGRRSLANAARLSRSMASDHIFLDGDGLGPEELIELVRFHLDRLPGSGVSAAP